jgi:hypothetical protein
VLADAVAVGAEGGFAVEAEPSVVAAAFTVATFPMYLLKHTRCHESAGTPLGTHACYVFLAYYNCARNGLSLGPSFYFVITSHHAQTMTHCCYLS